MVGFKYDIVTLIELVESKPCIWDKRNENNKNKILCDKSWHEIFLFLEDSYEELSKAEKKKTGDTIMAKWSNTRDAFMRSLRVKSGQEAKKNYMYSEHLQFLLTIAQKGETESNFSQAGTEDDNIKVEELADSDKATSQTPSAPLTYPSTSSEYRPKSKRQLDDIEREILTEIKKGKQSVEPCSHNYPRSDHEMLLLSFLPYLRDMSQTELMDFQMGVLTNIQKIKQQRAMNQREMNHSHSNQSSLQNFDYQLPPPSNQMEQQEQSTQIYLTNYTETFE